MSEDNTYYIVFHKFSDKVHKLEDPVNMCICKHFTKQNMDTLSGFNKVLTDLREEYECEIRILNWKRLKDK